MHVGCVARVDDSLTVRLTDSALTPDFFPEDYQDSGSHGDPMPVRWLPLETLANGVYQVPSEVVSRRLERTYVVIIQTYLK